jgi:hypothetical protein
MSVIAEHFPFAKLAVACSLECCFGNALTGPWVDAVAQRSCNAAAAALKSVAFVYKQVVASDPGSGRREA